MTSALSHTLALFTRSFSRWRADRAARLSASLSYYTLFSLSPLLAICIALLGLIFGKANVERQVIAEVSRLAGAQTAEAISAMTAAADKPQMNWFIASIGFVILMVAALGVFVELKDALNSIWRVKDERKGLWAFVRFYFAPMTMLLGIGFLLLVSLVISTGLAAFSAYIATALPIGALVIWLIDGLVSVAFITFVFAVIYRFIPDVRLNWHDVAGGALIASLLFTIGRYLIGFYLGKAGLSSTYGAAGSLVAILIWVYYSAQILFFGAEFTRIYTYAHGSRAGMDATSEIVTSA